MTDAPGGGPEYTQPVDFGGTDSPETGDGGDISFGPSADDYGESDVPDPYHNDTALLNDERPGSASDTDNWGDTGGLSSTDAWGNPQGDAAREAAKMREPGIVAPAGYNDGTVSADFDGVSDGADSNSLAVHGDNRAGGDGAYQDSRATLAAIANALMGNLNETTPVTADTSAAKVPSTAVVPTAGDRPVETPVAGANANADSIATTTNEPETVNASADTVANSGGAEVSDAGDGTAVSGTSTEIAPAPNTTQDGTQAPDAPAAPTADGTEAPASAPDGTQPGTDVDIRTGRQVDTSSTSDTNETGSTSETTEGTSETEPARAGTDVDRWVPGGWPETTTTILTNGNSTPRVDIGTPKNEDTEAMGTEVDIWNPRSPDAAGNTEADGTEGTDDASNRPGSEMDVWSPDAQQQASDGAAGTDTQNTEDQPSTDVDLRRGSAVDMPSNTTESTDDTEEDADNSTENDGNQTGSEVDIRRNNAVDTPSTQEATDDTADEPETDDTPTDNSEQTESAAANATAPDTDTNAGDKGDAPDTSDKNESATTDSPEPTAADGGSTGQQNQQQQQDEAAVVPAPPRQDPNFEFGGGTEQNQEHEQEPDDLPPNYTPTEEYTGPRAGADYVEMVWNPYTGRFEPVGKTLNGFVGDDGVTHPHPGSPTPEEYLRGLQEQRSTAEKVWTRAIDISSVVASPFIAGGKAGFGAGIDSVKAVAKKGLPGRYSVTVTKGGKSTEVSVWAKSAKIAEARIAKMGYGRFKAAFKLAMQPFVG